MIAKFKVFEKLSEVGEEVICINPNVGRDDVLTYGKSYKILYKNDYHYFIINDMGFEDKFLFRRFVTPLEFKMKQYNL